MLETVQNLKGETLLKVVGYGFQDFIKDLEQAFEQGYRLDFESNENYPQQIGSYYQALMPKKVGYVKEKQSTGVSPFKELEVQEDEETSQQPVQTGTRGRKKAV